MIKLINLTEHEITFATQGSDDITYRVPVSGWVARCESEQEVAYEIEVENSKY